MIDHLRRLRAGEAVDKPIYDYSTHLRTEQRIPVEPAPVIVVEGILVLAIGPPVARCARLDGHGDSTGCERT